MDPFAQLEGLIVPSDVLLSTFLCELQVCKLQKHSQPQLSPLEALLAKRLSDERLIHLHREEPLPETACPLQRSLLLQRLPMPSDARMSSLEVGDLLLETVEVTALK